MKELVRYTIGGITSSVGEYVAYLITLPYIDAYFALIVGFITSTLISFVFNEYFVYVKKPGEHRNKLHALMKNFTTYFFTGIVVKECLLFVFLSIHISNTIAPILLLIVIAPLNYFVTKYWAFKKVIS